LFGEQYALFFRKRVAGTNDFDLEGFFKINPGPGWRIKAFSVQSKQQFVAGHVLEPTTGMNLVPVFAQFPGNMDSAYVPVFIDHCLDKRQALGDKFAVSDE
jgi:hypothetical protein